MSTANQELVDAAAELSARGPDAAAGVPELEGPRRWRSLRLRDV